VKKIVPVIVNGIECKWCPKCNNIKSYVEFYRGHSRCKICEQEWSKNNSAKRLENSRRWAKNNPDKIKISVRKWQKNNPDKVSKIAKRWRENNPEKAKESSKKWRRNNPEKVLEAHRNWLKTHPDWKASPDSGKEARKKWFKDHPEKIREYSKRNREKHSEYRRLWRENNRNLLRGYDKKRRLTPTGKLNDRMSVSIWQALRKNKNGYRWEMLVGYTILDLKNHLESLFSTGMTWDNIGEWHIDHIIPKSRFFYETPEDPEFKTCWALANLQPMWKLDNLSKHAKTMTEWKQYNNERTTNGTSTETTRIANSRGKAPNPIRTGITGYCHVRRGG